MSITPPVDILIGMLQQGGVPSDAVEARAAELLGALEGEYDLHPAHVGFKNGAVIREGEGKHGGWSCVVNGVDIAPWVDDWSITPDPVDGAGGSARLTVTIPLDYLDMRTEATP